jgi:large subunit ribosomal protein L18
MSRLTDKIRNTRQRKARIRAVVSGTAERPRLSVNISNTHVSAQLIDDVASKTIGSATTVGQKAATGTMTERAVWVGIEIAKVAKSKKIKQVVFDRSGKLYHGRVKALADAARENGLEF